MKAGTQLSRSDIDAWGRLVTGQTRFPWADKRFSCLVGKLDSEASRSRAGVEQGCPTPQATARHAICFWSADISPLLQNCVSRSLGRVQAGDESAGPRPDRPSPAEIPVAQGSGTAGEVYRRAPR